MKKLVLTILILLLIVLSGCQKKAVEEPQLAKDETEVEPKAVSEESTEKDKKALELIEPESLPKAKDTSAVGSGGGGGGGGGSSSGSEQSGESTQLNVCKNAQDDSLCEGLDLAYGEGFKTNCCSDEGMCC